MRPERKQQPRQRGRSGSSSSSASSAGAAAAAAASARAEQEKKDKEAKERAAKAKAEQERKAALARERDKQAAEMRAAQEALVKAETERLRKQYGDEDSKAWSVSALPLLCSVRLLAGPARWLPCPCESSFVLALLSFRIRTERDAERKSEQAVAAQKQWETIIKFHREVRIRLRWPRSLCYADSARARLFSVQIKQKFEDADFPASEQSLLGMKKIGTVRAVNLVVC